jgi:RNA polymerase sigma factor (sigma-70 family)
MPDANDMDLVREFARHNSEAAFTELVRRHVNLVYSVARRCTGNDGDAQDVTQAVFIILARKAAGLREKTLLTGWLYETTRFTAARLLRTNARRHVREQEAYMQSTLNEANHSEVWEKLAPHLETAMGKLNAADRALLVLRFYENKSGPEAAALLGIREDAAHKRVTRAIEKLRKVFAQRGVTLSGAAIAGAVSANSVQAAPVALVKTISAIAVAKGAAVTASTLTLVKETLKIMTHAKLKLAIGITAGILLVGGATTMVISQTTSDDKWTPQEIARQAQDAYAALSSYSDNGTVISEGGGQTTTTTFTTRLQRPNFFRLEWTSTGGSYNSKGAAWSDGIGNFFQMGAVGQNIKPQKMNSMQQAFASAMGVSSSAASVPATFFRQPYGDVLGVPALGRTELTKQNDEKIGGVDCSVFTSRLDATKLLAQTKLPKSVGSLGITTTTFWIGKPNHLIYQTRTTSEGMSITMPHQSDDNIKTILERQNKPATSEAIAAWRTQMDTMMKQAQGAKFVFTETHENISVNQKLSASDFAP